VSKISFIDFVKNENEKLKKIENSMELNKTGALFINELVNLYPVLAIVYENELTQIYNNLKVTEKYTNLVISAEQLTKMIKSYKLDHATQKLVITDLTKVTITKECITAPDFLKNELKIDKSNPYYYAVLSFFCQEEVFEILQLANANKK